MAKRKNQLADKLGGVSAESPPGWRDTIVAPPAIATPTPPGRASETTMHLQRKTYLLTPRLIDQIQALATRERVGVNELVRYLLAYAVDQVETGQHPLPTQPGKRRIHP